MKERSALDLINAEDALTQTFMAAHQDDLTQVGVWLTDFSSKVQQLQLKQTLTLASRIRSHLQSIGTENITDELEKLKERWNDELRDVTFLELSSKESENFAAATNGFGELVSKAFPLAKYDCSEAISCMALGRHTAAVLHCMRALEFPLRSLCNALKVDFKQDAWQNLVSRLQKRCKDIDALRRKPRGWKSWKKSFYSEALLEFLYLKDAWRNNAMHASSQYDFAEAEKILSHTRNFMQHLANRLSA